MVSCHDDGLHFSNCRGWITVESCAFHGLMDNPINVHGTSVPVTEILNSRLLRCRFTRPDSVGLGLWARPWHSREEMIETRCCTEMEILV